MEERQMKKVFGTPGKFQKTREIIPVPEGITRPCEAMKYFGCIRSTARNVIRQGYYIVDYHKKTTCPGHLDMTPEECYKLAWSIFHRAFATRIPWYIDPVEMVQEGVTGLLERAGDEKFDKPLFRFYICKNAMRNFFRKQVRDRHGSVNIDKDEVWMYVDESIDTWRKKNAQEDLTINLIDRLAA
jgi:hypothetical protein